MTNRLGYGSFCSLPKGEHYMTVRDIGIWVRYELLVPWLADHFHLAQWLIMIAGSLLPSFSLFPNVLNTWSV